MGVTVSINGGPTSNISGYSVTEDSTPLYPSDSSGGTGQINFSVAEDDSAEGSILFLNDPIVLTDGSNGYTSGRINSVQMGDGVAAVSAESRTAYLMADRLAAPFTGTLQDAFDYYLSLVDITTNVYVDPIIASTPVVFPGFNGNMWEYMKKMCAAYGVEVSLVSNNIVLRPVRKALAEGKRNISESLTVSNAELAQSVEVYYYNNADYTTTNTMVYPKGGWTSDVQIYQVDANQTLEIDIPVDVYLTSLIQPTPVNSPIVGKDYVGPDSVYTIAGKDGAPIPASAWTANGGSITASIGADGKTIHLVIVGASDYANVAPYRIGECSDTSDAYSSLRIMGQGVLFDKQKVTIPTGVPATKSSVLVGTTVDNPFISTISQAWDAGSIAAGRYASASEKLNVTTVGINRINESGAVNYPTFNSFNNSQGSNTFATFDTAQGTNTFADFTAQQYALVEDSFDNQAFGNVAGARVKYREAMYRIRNATITESEVSYSAERDTIFSDMNTLWAGETFADFNTQFGNKLFQDYAVIPLWQT